MHAQPKSRPEWHTICMQQHERAEQACEASKSTPKTHTCPQTLSQAYERCAIPLHTAANSPCHNRQAVARMHHAAANIQPVSRDTGLPSCSTCPLCSVRASIKRMLLRFRMLPHALYLPCILLHCTSLLASAGPQAKPGRATMRPPSEAAPPCRCCWESLLSDRCWDSAAARLLTAGHRPGQLGLHTVGSLARVDSIVPRRGAPPHCHVLMPSLLVLFLTGIQPVVIDVNRLAQLVYAGSERLATRHT